MGKFEQYGAIAQQYFVEEQKPVSVIAKLLNLTEKTLHDWKKKGDWEQKRADFLKSKFNCYASLYELTNLITQDALNTYKTEGEKPDKTTISFLTRAIDKLPKMKQLEQIEVFEQTAAGKDKDSSEETILKIHKYLMGEA